MKALIEGDSYTIHLPSRKFWLAWSVLVAVGFGMIAIGIYSELQAIPPMVVFKQTDRVPPASH